MGLSIINRKKLIHGFFDIEEVEACYENKETIKRILAVPKPAAAILLYKTDDHKVVFSRQQRVVAMLDGEEGWINEIPAGVVDKDEPTDKCAARESLEETGYRINDCTFITSMYVSPGYTTEKIDIYFSRISAVDKVDKGGGVSGEHEVIRIVEVPFDEAMRQVEDGTINDSKTIVALSWLYRRLAEGNLP